MRVLHFCNSFMVSSWCCLVSRPFAGHLVLKIRSISEFHAVLFTHTSGLAAEPDIERPWGGTSAYNNGLLPLCRGEIFRTFTIKP